MKVRTLTPLEEYLKLPEGYPAELIGGKIVMSPSPDVRHQEIAVSFLEKLLAHKNEGKALYEIDVHFDEENVLRPDIIFIKNENKKIIGEKWIEGAPDIVVEVVSPAASGRDFVEKKEVYEKFGVKEYWIIVPDEEKLYVFKHNGKRFELLCSGRSCNSHVLEGFKWGFEK